MTLEDLGYNSDLNQYRKEANLQSFNVGRIVLEHRDRYIVKTDLGEFDAELIGHLRFTAENRHHLPAVGDWVAFSEYNENKALIHSIYPRHSIIERQAVGKSGQVQIIATNVDYGLIIQSVNRDFNINRLERYIAICNTSNVKPIIVLSKIDLIEESELKMLLIKIEERITNVKVISISNESQFGIDQIKSLIKIGETYCLLGSSGVGKSTLLNKLADNEIMNTNTISQGIDRGKHVTTHRELIVLKNGSIIIDNPGMREVGLTDTNDGLEITFADITTISQNCKFRDCSHTIENDCAIIKAIKVGTIDSDSFSNFQKMERERTFFESTIEDKKKKDKNLGKMIRSAQKQRRNSKY